MTADQRREFMMLLILHETSRSLIDIVLGTGHTNPSHFVQAFRRGVSMASMPANPLNAAQGSCLVSSGMWLTARR